MDTKVYKSVPQEICSKIKSQTWDCLEVREGLPEGKGVFATSDIPIGATLCNYGGLLLGLGEARDMYKEKEFGNYLFEFKIGDNEKYFFLHSHEVPETIGKFINHSKLHPNCVPRLYNNGDSNGDKPEMLFITTRQISCGEELAYNYGDQYVGVASCIASCLKCLKCE
jgi:hypothetical protein